jgi:hypothetical protein
VSRPRLFERFATPARVTVVSAPPGSGKTVLLRSWIRESGLAERAAWVPAGPTALVYSAAVTGLAAAAAGTFVSGRGSRAAEPQPTAPPQPPPGPCTVPPYVPATRPATKQEDHGK